MIDVHRTSSDFEGIIEGDYNVWTKKWIAAIPGNLNVSYKRDFDAWMDDRNDQIYLAWRDAGSKYRWGVFNSADFTSVFLSPSGSHYLIGNTYLQATHIHPGMAFFEIGGISRSIETYLLLLNSDYYTFEVWREGNKIKSCDIRNDFHTANCYSSIGLISLTGKYLLFQVQDYDPVPDLFYLMLYEGSYV